MVVTAVLLLVLQFVSQSDNIQSCKFAQTMEQRLQKAFQDAERKVLNSRSNLTLQVGRRDFRLHRRQTAVMQILPLPRLKAFMAKCKFVLLAGDIDSHGIGEGD